MARVDPEAGPGGGAGAGVVGPPSTLGPNQQEAGEERQAGGEVVLGADVAGEHPHVGGLGAEEGHQCLRGRVPFRALAPVQVGGEGQSH